MKLSRNTPANVFDIRTPVWSGGRQVGLATHKIGIHNQVNILWKDKEGNLAYPNPMYISGDKARTYPTRGVKGYNIKLYMVPVGDLEILERE